MGGWMHKRKQTEQNEKNIQRYLGQLWSCEEKKEKEGKLWEYYGEIKKGELGSFSRYA